MELILYRGFQWERPLQRSYMFRHRRLTDRLGLAAEVDLGQWQVIDSHFLSCFDCSVDEFISQHDELRQIAFDDGEPLSEIFKIVVPSSPRAGDFFCEASYGVVKSEVEQIKRLWKECLCL